MALAHVVNRRSLSRRVLLQGVVLGTVATALVACSSSAPASPTAVSAPAPTAASTSASAAAPTAAATPATAAAKPTTAARPTTQASTAGGTVPEATMNPSAAKGKTLHLLAWNLYKADGM